MNFKDGQMVKAGDVLFEIDHREYQAALDKTKAALLQAEVRVMPARVGILPSSAAGAEQNDQSGAIRSDRRRPGARPRPKSKWNRRTSKRPSTTSPGAKSPPTSAAKSVGGRVDPGNIVEKEKTVLTDIVALDPMFAVFDIDERTVLRLQRNVKDGKLLLSQDHELPIKIGLADETGYSIDAKVNFIDNKIDTGTGTLPRARLLSTTPCSFQAPGPGNGRRITAFRSVFSSASVCRLAIRISACLFRKRQSAPTRTRSSSTSSMTKRPWNIAVSSWGHCKTTRCALLKVVCPMAKW